MNGSIDPLVMLYDPSPSDHHLFEVALLDPFPDSVVCVSGVT